MHRVALLVVFPVFAVLVPGSAYVAGMTTRLRLAVPMGE